MNERIQWHVEKRKISDLKPYTKNPRIITEDGLKQLEESFDEIGLAQPININLDDTILSGHARWNQLKKEDMNQEVDVYVPNRELTDKEEEAVVIRMNKNVAGKWDFDILANEFEFDELKDWGFEESELTGPEVEKIEGKTDDNQVPELRHDPITKTGDVWILGKHRVMCGDSTIVTDVEKLMNGERANISFTSPPYNAGDEVEIGSKGHKYETHDDDMGEDNYLELLNDFTSNSLMFSDMSIVNIQQLAGNKISFIEYLNNMKNNLVDIAIWNKTYGTPALPRRVMNSAFEYILFFSNENNPPKTIKTAPDFHGRIQNVYDGSKQTKNEFSKIHRATFPVHLPEFVVENFSTGSVLDLFNGTGTTLIACEKLGRKCFAMDMDPLYIDVTIKRWEEFTGQKAVLENGEV